MEDRRSYNPHHGTCTPNSAESIPSNMGSNHFNSENNTNTNYNPFGHSFEPNEAGSIPSNMGSNHFNSENNTNTNYNPFGHSFEPNEAGSIPSNMGSNYFNSENNTNTNYNPFGHSFEPNEAGSIPSNMGSNDFNSENNTNTNYNPFGHSFEPNEAGSIPSNMGSNYFNSENNTNTNYNPFGHSFAPIGAGSIPSNTGSNHFNSENYTNTNYNPFGHSFGPIGAGSIPSNTGSNHFNSENYTNTNFNPFGYSSAPNGAESIPSNTGSNHFNSENYTNTNFNPFGYSSAPNGAGFIPSNTGSNHFNSENNINRYYNPFCYALEPNGAGSIPSNMGSNHFNSENNTNRYYNPFGYSFAPYGAGSLPSNTGSNHINSEYNTTTNNNPYSYASVLNRAVPRSLNTTTNQFRSGNNTNYNPYNERLPSSRPNRFENNPNVANARLNRIQTESFQNNPETMRRVEYFMGFHRLLELSKQESSETIIMELVAKMASFETLLDSDLEKDWIVLIIKILSKAFSSPFFENKIAIMNIVLQQKFITTLEKYVTVQSESIQNRCGNRHFWGNEDDFFFDLAIVCDFLIDSVPTSACRVLHLLKIVDASIAIFVQQKIHLSDFTKYKFKNAIQKLEQTQVREEASPADDFRTLRIFPTFEELFSRSPALIGKNIIDGRYDDVEQYLDVQFRLLKEDFVAPLRRGIAAYFEQGMADVINSKKFLNIRIHKAVVFVSLCVINFQVGVVLKFLAEDVSAVFNRNIRRFIHGSLVCFTKDNFNTVLIGRILEKDTSLQQLVIGFEPDHMYDFNVPYLMVECQVYFEPYYYVLQALQSISAVELPMKSYLVDVSNTVVPPHYLDTQSGYVINNRRVQLFDDESWPSAKALKLNPSQYSAFKASLTQNLAVIQGPPGTGKTFLGIQIVKTLLDKRNISNWYNRTPILVVSFTNHALDQFLEGLIGITDRIVRIGGQCKSDRLKEFQMQNKKRSHTIHMFMDALRSSQKQLDQFWKQIKRTSGIINEIQKFDSIIPFKNFDLIDNEIQTSWFAQASRKELIAWLFGAREMRTVNINTSELQSVGETDPENHENEDIEEIPDATLEDAFEFLSDFDETHLLSVNFLSRKIGAVERTLADADNGLPSGNYEMKQGTQQMLAHLTHMLEYLKDKLQNARNAAPPVSKPPVNYRFPNLMQPGDRWDLYFFWVHLYNNYMVDSLVNLRYQHNEVYKQYTEITNMNDTELMKDMLVVGMTTTGAARLQTTLQALKCRIVVVEEAAEVLESHVTVSLTKHCQHLILIGDHQQLRPSAADYIIENEFNLGISMFERMVLNNIPCNVLGVQHRMHPQIASLITPAIYPKLENHPSVHNFPPILGIQSRLYFIHHTNREIQSGFDSKANVHEAKYLINLARYLVQNGYNPKDITVLATYSSQLFTILKERNTYVSLLRDVNVRVLDNYQGEESKIVLLSLVRNNDYGKIGFLKIENRVCVALSRAKEGFYMMGNMDLLCENSEIWPKIRKALVEQDSLGTSLAVHCQIHPDRVTLLAKPEDFNKVRDGGCNEICGSLLNCGHNCTRLCHILDRDHSNTRCKVRCSKVLCELGHTCHKLCYQECDNCVCKVSRILECGHNHILNCSLDQRDFECSTLVTATLPCGHIIKKPCHLDVNELRCQVPCDSRIELCGHWCMQQCHIRDDPGHIQYKCYAPCEQVLQGCSNWEHKCPRFCYEDCPPYCEVLVKMQLPNCGRLHEIPCNVRLNNISCIEPCRGQ